MSPADIKYRVQLRPQDPELNALDAKSLACNRDGIHAISTPNMSYVPEPHCDADEELRARKDGRFGSIDCFQWPQTYAKQTEWSVCILRKDRHESPDPLAWAWYTPTCDDLLPHSVAPSPYGLLNERSALGLAALADRAYGRYNTWKAPRGGKPDIASEWVQCLKHFIRVLHHQPLTHVVLVATVAQAQRLFLDIIAFLDYVEIVQPRIFHPSAGPHPVRDDWMGYFTRDTNVCNELFRAGVPVWLQREYWSVTDNTIVESLVKYTFPDKLVHRLYSEPGQGARLFPILYKGPGGSDRHWHTRRVFDPMSIVPSSSACKPAKPASQFPSSSQPLRSCTASKARPYPVVGMRVSNCDNCNKWESSSEYLPAQLLAWESAMKRVGKNAPPFMPAEVDAGYRVPEPAMLVSSQSPERRRLYLINWLAVRPHWLRLVTGTDPPARFPSLQMWRDLLSCHKASDQKQTTRQASLSVFGEECMVVTQGGDVAPTTAVVWRGEEVSVATLLDPPRRLVQALLWDIFEIGFRLELRLLDQLLVPRLWQEHPRERRDLIDCLFTSRYSFEFWNEQLPRSPGKLGLMNSVPKSDEGSALRSFCHLLSGWPGSPDSLSDPEIAAPGCSENEQHLREFDRLLKATFFYVQTFYAQYRRPPLVPHTFPLEYFS